MDMASYDPRSRLLHLLTAVTAFLWLSLCNLYPIFYSPVTPSFPHIYHVMTVPSQERGTLPFLPGITYYLYLIYGLILPVTLTAVTLHPGTCQSVYNIIPIVLCHTVIVSYY